MPLPSGVIATPDMVVGTCTDTKAQKALRFALKMPVMPQLLD
jgi:hypothetical protein